ncbi:Patatin-like phospholipase [Vibrio mediterranei]|uniref:patatin family protein n=1 Tax=Vibrio mediterranei TaxID=689 RepID=UPI000783A553|nr:patatin family protein [Vibrio mediterranei]SBO12607.1 Patatin-like phospholipase [Vibrio mediterranei]
MRLPIILVLTALIAGCSSSPHDSTIRVNESNYLQAQIGPRDETVSIVNEPYRIWGDQVPKNLKTLKEDYYDKGNLDLLKNAPGAPKVIGDRFNVLVLSGGGPRGAYGAGVINGLKDKGELPEFSLITGVSAGALIAPFVFVGGDKYDELKTVMLGLNDDMMLGGTSIFKILFGDAFSEGDNFYKMVQKTFDDEFIEEIAKAHRSGKRMLIGTNHFDSGRQMIWNVGRIATSDLPNRNDIIHQVLAASSSIPGVFPPQFIPVEYNGQSLEEMHVDGGLSSQLFFDPVGFDFTKVTKALGYEKPPHIYIIRNGRLRTEFKFIEDDTVSLAARSVDNLILAQTRGDVFREMYISKKIGAKLFLTYVDESYTQKPQDGKFFDPDFLKALYDYGYKKATNEKVWVNEIPLIRQSP